jgi:hypothetical protein
MYNYEPGIHRYGRKEALSSILVRIAYPAVKGLLPGNSAPLLFPDLLPKPHAKHVIPRGSFLIVMPMILQQPLQIGQLAGNTRY